eukprot:237850_1
MQSPLLFAVANFCNDGTADIIWTNGILAVERFTGGNATLKCNSGYQLISSTTNRTITTLEVSTCKAVDGAGDWSTQTATCKLTPTWNKMWLVLPLIVISIALIVFVGYNVLDYYMLARAVRQVQEHDAEVEAQEPKTKITWKSEIPGI